MRCVFLKTAALAAIACSACLTSGHVAWAFPSMGGNCGSSSCHTGTTADTVSASLDKTSYAPGETVKITFTVANPAGDNFRAALTGSPVGTTSTTNAIKGALGNTLTVPAPSEGTTVWRSYGSGLYYANPSDSSAASYAPTFTFTLPTTTTPDTYTLYTKAGGGAGGDWEKFTTLQLNVGAVPEPATLAMILGGALLGFICWRGRKRSARP